MAAEIVFYIVVVVRDAMSKRVRCHKMAASKAEHKAVTTDSLSDYDAIDVGGSGHVHRDHLADSDDSNSGTLSTTLDVFATVHFDSVMIE